VTNVMSEVVLGSF